MMREKIINYIRTEKNKNTINYCNFGKHIWKEAQRELLEELNLFDNDILSFIEGPVEQMYSDDEEFDQKIVKWWNKTKKIIDKYKKNESR